MAKPEDPDQDTLPYSGPESGEDEVDCPWKKKSLVKLQECSPEHKRVMMLHNPKNVPKFVELLLKKCLDVNSIEMNVAPIHSIVEKKRKDRADLMVALLTYSDADVDLKRADGMTALHMAAQDGALDCAEVLIAFGANVNISNAVGKTPLDIAKGKPHLTFQRLESWTVVSTEEGTDYQTPEASGSQNDKFSEHPETKDELEPSSLEEKQVIETEMEQLLKSLGAVCAESMQQQDAASISITPQTPTREFIGRAAAYTEGKVSRKLYKDLKDWMNEMMSSHTPLPTGDVLQALPLQQKELERYKLTGNRILCLDGGGIKGLVQIDILSQIEEATGKRIVELFDWIIATSTGGILALAIVYAKKSLRELRQLYLKLKDEVFASPKFGIVFNTKALERLLKDNLGEHMKMKDVTHPKVLVAAVNKQTTPLQLHLFNNCFDNQYSDKLIWKVARYTSAHPMVFSEFENYVDGGVLANNPSEVGLTEIQDFHLQRGEKLPISLVVSVGTGVYPVEKLGSIDARQYLWMGKHWLKFKDSFNRLGNLIQLLSNALVESEMVARTCEGSCKEQGIPFYRLSPLLPEVISAGETDNKKLLQMIISTRKETWQTIQKLAKLHLM